MNRHKHNIAYFCPSKSWGGLEMNQLRNATWMNDRGHKVLLFVQKNSKVHQEASQVGLPVVFVQSHRKHYDIVNAIRLIKKIKKQGVTHLIVRDPKDMSLCALAKFWSFKKIFLAYFMEMQIGMRKRDFLHTLRFSIFDLWSCPLPGLKKQVVELTKFPAHKIQVIPSGIELEKYFLAPNNSKAKQLLSLDETRNYIGLVGRFDPQKGQFLLLKAFNEIKNKVNHNLVFLGESNQEESDRYLNKLEEFVKQNQLEERVFFRPFRKDVEIFYKAVDVFVMATKSETFGMVTIEALASGCKVVGSDRGGTIEILNHGEFGMLFEAENKNDLAKKLIASINDKGFDPQVVIEESKKYDAQRVCELVENALGCG